MMAWGSNVSNQMYLAFTVNCIHLNLLNMNTFLNFSASIRLFIIAKIDRIQHTSYRLYSIWVIEYTSKVILE